MLSWQTLIFAKRALTHRNTRTCKIRVMPGRSIEKSDRFLYRFYKLSVLSRGLKQDSTSCYPSVSSGAASSATSSSTTGAGAGAEAALAAAAASALRLAIALALSAFFLASISS